MPVVTHTEIQISGDVGGVGICRLSWLNTGGTVPTATECGSAGGAAVEMITEVVASIPADIAWTVQQTFKCFDVATAAITAEVAATAPFTAIPGDEPSHYAAGIGVRGYWHTSTIKNRRFVRGALFWVPIGSGGFNTNGSVAAATAALYAGAMSDYLAGMAGVGLFPVVWARPTKIAPASGTVAEITSASVGPTPAGLRTRRS